MTIAVITYIFSWCARIILRILLDDRDGSRAWDLLFRCNHSLIKSSNGCYHFVHRTWGVLSRNRMIEQWL